MKAWEGCIASPVAERSEKPRNIGLTMVIDKGLGLSATRDLVDVASPYVDIVKFTFGTSAFYDKEFCREKIRILRDAGIWVMPGGTFLEVAVWQGRYFEYLKRAKELGFDTIEVSDGTIDMDLGTREEVIKRARDEGFTVISEVGKKDPSEALPMETLCRLVERDVEWGTFKVIVEAREAGRGIGIYDKEGKVKEGEVDRIVSLIGDPNVLIWEAPLKAQQQYLILRFGANVNLGNVPPEDILALEALRQGLRGDTLKKAYREGR